MVNMLAGVYEMLPLEGEYLRIAVVSPAVFDPFGQKLFIALLKGHCVYLVPDEIKKSRSIFDYLKRNEIDLIDGTPSYLRLLLDFFPDDPVFPKYWLLGGEVIPGHMALSLYEKYGNNRDGVVLLNEYGLTECSVASSGYRVDFDKSVQSEMVPIGKPIRNTELYILDEQLNFLPDGMIGEIAIAGAGIGLGYLNRPELTADKFVRLPSGERVFRTGDLGRYLPDGNLLCLGRKDRQIKLHGYRIELGEIESALKKREGVKDTFVICREDSSGEKYLVAYYTTFGTEEIKDIQSHLKTMLPQYMIPSYILHLASFPLTLNGKLNPALLPDPLSQIESPGAILGPRNETEEWLMQVWQEVLGKELIGVKDDFFEIGGHSLRAVQVLFRIQKEYLVPISMTSFFMRPTIEDLAREIESLASLKHAAHV
jgi:acyl-CoA synthetase (AMP-forming)/AMP-acid ligase II/acyl carrier protein